MRTGALRQEKPDESERESWGQSRKRSETDETELMAEEPDKERSATGLRMMDVFRSATILEVISSLCVSCSCFCNYNSVHLANTIHVNISSDLEIMTRIFL